MQKAFIEKRYCTFQELLTECCCRTNTGCEQREGTGKADEWRGLSRVINSVCTDPLNELKYRQCTVNYQCLLYCKEMNVKEWEACLSRSANLTRKKKCHR